MTMPELPLFFGSEGRPLFGWYHPGTVAGREGLVICSPFGQEELCAHRTVRHLARAAAEHGTSTLRFDYDGCGDSAGDDLDPDRVSSWLSSVDTAIEELKRRAGVGRVCLLGVRMGALLASLAAAKRDDVSSLIAISPVVSGRAFVREWTALSVVGQWRTADPSAVAPEKPGAVSRKTSIEAAGYVMTKATTDELARIDLTQLPRVAVEVLIIDRDDLPRRERWSKHLTASGAQVTHEVLPGYLGMMSEPHNCQVPHAILDRVLAWLSREGVDRRSRSGRGVLTDLDHAGTAQVSDGVRETPIQLDDHGVQFGILSEPSAIAPQASAHRGLILINSGACRHIGPNRSYVQFARHFAEQGWTVLRLDVSGIGDSDPHYGQPENAPYTALAQRDIAMWLALLKKRGLSECHLLGVCSGAYHGVKAAAAGMQLASVLPVNPLTFFWRDGMPLDPPPFGDHHVFRKASNSANWRRLISGDIYLVGRFALMLTRRSIVHARNGLRSAARATGIRLRDDIVAELHHAKKHGIKLHFIFADGDPGLSILREQGGSAVQQLLRERSLSIRMLEGTDHTFSTLAARNALLSEVETRLSPNPRADDMDSIGGPWIWRTRRP